MNFIYKITITILLILSTVIGTIMLANFGYLDNAIKHIVQYYFNINGYDCSINNLKFKHGSLSVGKALVKSKNSEITISIDDISSNFVVNFNDLNMENSVSTNRLTIYQNPEEKIFDSRLTGNMLLDRIGSPREFTITAEDIQLSDIDTSSGHAEFSFTKEHNRSTFLVIMNLNQSSFLHGKVTTIDKNPSNSSTYNAQEKIEAYATFQNIPIRLSKVAKVFSPNNDTIRYLADSLTHGTITKGNVDINLNDRYLENGVIDQNHISADFIAQDVTYIYNSEMPEVKNVDLHGHVKGMITELTLSKSTIANFNFPGAKIIIDLDNEMQQEVRVLGSGVGPVAGLTEFIPTRVIKNLQDSDIDLTKFSGDADVDLDIQIPLSDNENNVFDIRAEIPDTGLNIFNDKIRLSEAKLSGRLLDNDLDIRGSGFVNKLASNIEFRCNIDPNTPFHQLTINTISNFSEDNVADSTIQDEEQLGPIRYSKGSTNFMFDYKSVNYTGAFEIYSDLTDLDIYIDRLGIHKKRGENAVMQATGELYNLEGYNFDFIVSGSQKLDVKGSISHNDGTTNISIPTLQHKDTKIAANILHDKDVIDINLSGEVLDLHNADLFQFMQKEENTESIKTNLKATIDEIKLKNDIWLDNLLINLECNMYGCFEGSIKADIGSRNINVDLSSDGDSESWDIFSSNAGATLKAFGLYNEMRAGTLRMNIETAKQQVQPGEIIPIRKGTFSVEKFGLGNTPFLTRMISVVSLPGFLGMVTNNKDILFSSMKGNFIFDGSMIEVKQSSAEGPFFSFSLNGNIDVVNKNLDVKGYVTPELYGISSMVKTIPFVGKFIAGDKSSGGLLSASYKIQQDY